MTTWIHHFFFRKIVKSHTLNCLEIFWLIIYDNTNLFTKLFWRQGWALVCFNRDGLPMVELLSHIYQNGKLGDETQLRFSTKLRLVFLIYILQSAQSINSRLHNCRICLLWIHRCLSQTRRDDKSIQRSRETGCYIPIIHDYTFKVDKVHWADDCSLMIKIFAICLFSELHFVFSGINHQTLFSSGFKFLRNRLLWWLFKDKLN